MLNNEFKEFLLKINTFNHGYRKKKDVPRRLVVGGDYEGDFSRDIVSEQPLLPWDLY